MGIVFRTERLELREFAVTDAGAFHALNADPEVIRYTGDPPFASVAAAERLIREYGNYRRDGFGRWSVFRRSDGAYLGFCGLSLRPALGEVDVGFRFARRFWGEGYATEAAHGSLRHGFRVLGLPRIVGRAQVDNRASHRVLEKLGMRLEKRFTDAADGTEWLQHRISREEFVG